MDYLIRFFAKKMAFIEFCRDCIAIIFNQLNREDPKDLKEYFSLWSLGSSWFLDKVHFAQESLVARVRAKRIELSIEVKMEDGTDALLHRLLEPVETFLDFAQSRVKQC